MRRIILASVLSIFVVGSAMAQMMGEGGMRGMGMGPMSMGEHMGPDLMAACMVDLGDMGLSAEAQKSLEGKRFELQKKSIRLMADLKILKLEASRLLENRTFDLKAAESKIAEISAKEAEMHSAHLGYLHDLGALLSDAQWETLKKNHMAMMPMMGGKDCMMPMMDGKGHMMPMMGGKGGMMMEHRSKASPGDADAHHPGDKDEAEKFFQEKK